MILSFAPDLMTRSKIDLASRHYGVGVVHAADEAEFRAALDAQAPGLQLVIVDADREGADTIAMIRAARAAAPHARVVAFCSHVLGDVIRAAREAGAHTVMANSTFAAAVPGLVAPLAQQSETT